MPEAMKADCKPVHGKVPGPANHVLCGKHGHVLDTKAKHIIAKNLDEYKKLFAHAAKMTPEKMKPDCAPVHGKVPGPANHQLCSKHGHVLDVKAKMIIAKTVEDYKKSFK